jgi:flagellar operon protein
MIIQNDYLRARSVSVTTGQVSGFPNAQAPDIEGSPIDSPFARELQSLLAENTAKAGGTNTSTGINAVGETTITGTISFSKHALSRIEERGIDISEDTIARLTRSLNMAKAKNCSESLMLIDGDAFLVSVDSGKVITAMPEDDIRDSIFTNIDSTVIG